MTYSSRLDYSGAKKGRSVSLVLVALAITIGVAAFRWLQSRNAPAPSTVQVAVISGQAAIVRADAGADAPVVAGEMTSLQRGDEISTSSDGQARLTFGGGETAELGPNTRLELLELYLSPMTRGLVAVLALHQGGVLARIRHVLFRGMRFEVQTPVVTVAARGTAFRCDLLSSSQARIVVLEGVVDVSMGEQSVELEAGQMLDAHLGQPLVPAMAPASAPSTEGQQTLSPSPEGTFTLTAQEKTLFPPVVTPTRPGDNIRVYTVQAGDTLYSIARMHNTSWKAIWEANKDILAKPEMIRVGQELRIP